jgi:Transmembrane domain of unknown function (DUF3566)
VTSGPGDPRTLGGAPLFGDPSKSAAPRSAVIPETVRSPGGDGRPAGPPMTGSGSTTVVPGGSGSGSPTGSGSPPSSSGTSSSGPARPPMTVGTAPVTRKKGRRARLTIKRIDPWSTLKFSFVYGLAGMVVLLVSVIVLYGVVDAMGVISSIRNFLGDVSSGTGSPSSGSSIAAWFGFGRVMLVTIVVGLVNVVLFTAFATLTAFIYNVCTDIVGGVEITLAERN